MSDSPADELSPQERLLVDKVRNIVLALEKTTRAQKLYLDNNEILIKMRERLRSLFSEFLKEEVQLDLRVEAQRFLYLDQPVYENADHKESFAYRLYSEGMRAIRFKEGLTQTEIDQFVALLNIDPDQARDKGQSSSTMLWEEEFDHIQYTIAEFVIDDPDDQLDDRVDQLLDHSMEGFAGPTLLAATEDIEEDIDLESLAPDHKFRVAAKEICVLNEEEFAQIQREIAHGETHERLRMDLFDILMTLVLEERDDDDLEKLHQILLETIDATVINGELNITSQIVWSLRGLLEGGLGDFALRYPDRILHILDDLGSQQRILRYLNSLNLGYNGSAKDIVNFFGSLPKSSFSTMLGHIHIVSSAPLRRELSIAAAQLYDKEIAHFAKAFRVIKNPNHLLDVLFILSQTRDHRAIDYMKPVLTHADRSVRLNAITTLRDLSPDGGSEYLVNMIDDNDTEIRYMAVKALANSNKRSIGVLFLEKIQDDAIYDMDLKEKRNYFNSASLILKDELIPYLRKLLSTSKLFKRQAMEEIYQCAAYALKTIGSEAAIATLHEFEEKGNKMVRMHCARELRRSGGRD